jgi:O-antigen/teichoic acid export membrane protein
MLKKISQIVSWNILTAFFNFGLNFVLARQLGNAFFGEFSLYNAKIALLGLIFIIIPSNFAVVKFQDDKRFKGIYFTFYVLGGFVFLTLLFVCWGIGYLNLPVYSMFLYSFPMFFINFFDCALQADNKLNQYFKILFIISLIKLVTFFTANYFEFIHGLNDVVFSIGFGNTVCVFFLILAYRKTYFSDFKGRETIQFIIANFNNFKGYYINNIIKSLADNFFIFLFNGILNKDQLGLFSLFIKAQSFSFSLFRILEAFLMNRDNNKAYYNKINAKKYFLGFVLLLMTFVISIVYMYSLNKKIYVVESLLISFCAISYVGLLMIRSQLILAYDNRSLNITMMTEMVVMLIFMSIIKLYSISGTVIICLCFVLFSSIFRVIFLKNIIKKKYVKFY